MEEVATAFLIFVVTIIMAALILKFQERGKHNNSTLKDSKDNCKCAKNEDSKPTQ